MKKVIALLLALLVVVGLAACGGNEQGNQSNPEVTTTEPPVVEVTTTEAPTEDPNSKIITAGSLSNHENGWEVEAWNEGAAGIYFNMWTNDLPYNSDWSVRYQPHDGNSVTLIRDGEKHMIGGPGIELLVKFSANSYYLSFDQWIIPELFPLQENDVIVLEGDFTNPENGYTIHLDKTYVQLKVGGITKFTTEAPEGITE